MRGRLTDPAPRSGADHEKGQGRAGGGPTAGFGAFRHDIDLARCARRHGAYERDLAAIGVGFRLAADADTRGTRPRGPRPA